MLHPPFLLMLGGFETQLGDFEMQLGGLEPTERDGVQEGVCD